MVTTTNHTVPDTFEEPYEGIFDAQGDNHPTLQGIWEDVYGDDYPTDANPDPTNFMTRTDLERIVNELQVHAGQTVADLGCGRGKFTLWMAQQSGANFLGIDLSDEAIHYAKSLVNNSHSEHKVHFQQGTFEASGLDDCSIDGAVSTDALMFASDITDACHEVARILRLGACFIFTSWEMSCPSPSLQLPIIPDYKPMLIDAGLTIEVYEETPNWEVRQRAILAGIVANKDQLMEEMGEADAMHLYHWALARPNELSNNRRVFVKARKDS